jgi:hypothetical protein
VAADGGKQVGGAAARYSRRLAWALAAAGIWVAVSASTGASAQTLTYPNWAGYVATGGRYTGVRAQWVVPRGHCGPAESQAAFWVGFDETTVEQTGIALDCTNGQVSYSGWYQMYPSPPHGLGGTITAGDRMTGAVSYQGQGEFTLRLADQTRHWASTIVVHRQRIDRASAEAIAEASYGPLAQFGTVQFSNVRVNQAPVNRFNPQRVNMAGGGHMLALTSGLNGANFSIRWQHS